MLIWKISLTLLEKEREKWSARKTRAAPFGVAAAQRKPRGQETPHLPLLSVGQFVVVLISCCGLYISRTIL